LLELAGPKQLVLVDVNGKVKAGPRDNPREPCVEHTQELIIYNMADLATKISDIPPTFLRDFLSLEEQDTLCLNDLEEEFFFSVNFIFSRRKLTKIADHFGLIVLLGRHRFRWLQEPLLDDIHNI